MAKYTFDNLDRIFSLQEVSDSKVIIKVNADSPLTIAQYPFIEKQFAYITVTRGKDHNLVIVYDDGHTWSFRWGLSGETIIDDTTFMLRVAVCQFIEENNILFGYSGGSIYEAKIFYSKSYGWGLGLWIKNGDDCCIWSKTANDAESMIEECKKYIVAEEWEYIKARDPIGRDEWVAKNFKILFN